MILRINSNDIQFKVEQPTLIIPINSTRDAGDLAYKYTSDNYTLPERELDAAPVSVKLVNTFSTIELAELAIHEFFYLASINPGVRTFAFFHENGSGRTNGIIGVIKDGINVVLTKYGGTILVRINFKIEKSI